MSTILLQEEFFNILRWSDITQKCSTQHWGFFRELYREVPSGHVNYQLLNLKLVVHDIYHLIDFRPHECMRELPIINGSKPYYLLRGDKSYLTRSEKSILDMSMKERYTLGKQAYAYDYQDLQYEWDYTGGLLVGRNFVKGPWYAYRARGALPKRG